MKITNQQRPAPYTTAAQPSKAMWANPKAPTTAAFMPTIAKALDGNTNRGYQPLSASGTFGGTRYFSATNKKPDTIRCNKPDSASELAPNNRDVSVTENGSIVSPEVLFPDQQSKRLDLVAVGAFLTALGVSSSLILWPELFDMEHAEIGGFIGIVGAFVLMPSMALLRLSRHDWQKQTNLQISEENVCMALEQKLSELTPAEKVANALLEAKSDENIWHRLIGQVTQEAAKIGEVSDGIISKPHPMGRWPGLDSKRLGINYLKTLLQWRDGKALYEQSGAIPGHVAKFLWISIVAASSIFQWKASNLLLIYAGLFEALSACMITMNKTWSRVALLEKGSKDLNASLHSSIKHSLKSEGEILQQCLEQVRIAYYGFLNKPVLMPLIEAGQGEPVLMEAEAETLQGLISSDRQRVIEILASLLASIRKDLAKSVEQDLAEHRLKTHHDDPHCFKAFILLYASLVSHLSLGFVPGLLAPAVATTFAISTIYRLQEMMRPRPGIKEIRLAELHRMTVIDFLAGSKSGSDLLARLLSYNRYRAKYLGVDANGKKT